tara:strand:+ start:1804 stop:3504 length:1701 start_codon:yes stop_codon:yes gene_type:complete
MDEKQLERLQKAAEISRDRLQTEEDSLKKQGDISDRLERTLKTQQEELKVLSLKLQRGLATAQAYDDQNAKVEQQLKLLNNIKEVEKETESIVTSIAAKFGLVESGATKFIKKLSEGGDQSKAMSASFSKAFGTIKSLASPLNLAVLAVTAIATKTAEVVVEVDKVRAGFVGVTADTSDAMRMAERLTLSNLNLAISFGEMSKAQINLRTQFAQFGFLSDSVRESVTLQAAQLQKLGVDANTTASIMNTLTMSFGQTASEAAATQRDIIGLGQALKIPPAVIARDFAQALPHLAQFGERAIQVFEELSVAARESGVSVSDLTAIFGDQFNTFEGATTAAGRLNQALRTDVFSGMELLMANDAERLRIVKEGIQLSGIEFRNLERYEQLYIANAAGIRDVAQAQAILGDTQADVAMRIGDTSFSVAEMEDMAQKATATMDKMKFIFMQLAVAVSPLVDMFGSIVQGVLNVTAPTRASGVPIGDAHFGPGEVKGIVTNSGVAVPNQMDTISAAKDKPLEMINELKAIKNAILQNNGGNFNINIDGQALDAKIKKVAGRQLRDTTLGPI